MIPVPLSLDSNDCPLLKRYGHAFESAIQQFNKAQETAKRLSTEFPAYYSLEEVQLQVQKLTELREKLQEKRLKVGFLGPFQCGKSTTINNILRRNVSGTGNNTACTSVVTRLVVDPKASEPPTLEMRYFTVEEYQKRRNTLCEWARLPNAAGLTESQILARLENPLSNSGPSNGQRPVLRDDIPFLKKFLQTYESVSRSQQNPVRAVAHVETGQFDRKDDFLTHSSEDHDDKINPYFLLSEAQITIPGGETSPRQPSLDPELELVDCPGLGANRSVDTLLTKEYIPKLDGAVVFLRAGALFDTAAEEILSDLTAFFGAHVPSRVWIIVNQMDTTTREAKLVGTKGDTTFHAISKIKSKYHIPLSQVFLGSMKIYQLSQESDQAADRKEALAKLDLREEDSARLAEIFRDCPELEPAFEQLLIDGGIGFLRRLLSERIGGSVADSLLKHGQKVAADCRSNLELTLKSALAPASEAEQGHARAWNAFLIEMITELSGPGYDGRRGVWFDLSERLARDVRKETLDLYLKNRPTDRAFASMEPEDFRDQITHDGASLDSSLRQHYPKIVQKFFQAISTEIEKRQLPEIVLAGGQTPQNVWSEMVRILKDTNCDAHSFPGVLDPEVLRRLTEVDFVSRNQREEFLRQSSQKDHYPQHYDLLRRRVRTIVHEMAQWLRVDALSRLETLRRDVRRKLNPALRNAPQI